MIPFVIDSMPQKIRTTGFALSYSLATALFGGFTPAVATFLIYKTGNKAAPAWWLSLAAALSLTAAFIARYRRILPEPARRGKRRGMFGAQLGA
jgi:MFS transporter, MHS family, citrate/tricarballylate:H+ symporter